METVHTVFWANLLMAMRDGGGALSSGPTCLPTCSVRPKPPICSASWRCSSRSSFAATSPIRCSRGAWPSTRTPPGACFPNRSARWWRSDWRCSVAGSGRWWRSCFRLGAGAACGPFLCHRLSAAARLSRWRSSAALTKFSLGIMGSEIFNFITFQSPLVVVSRHLGLADAGAYSAANRFSSIPNQVVLVGADGRAVPGLQPHGRRPASAAPTH